MGKRCQWHLVLRICWKWFGLVQAEWENGEQADDLNVSTECATRQSYNMKPNLAPSD